MISRILKWGNSLSIRIPKVFSKELNLNEDSRVEIKTEENKIIISPIPAGKNSLEELLSQINESNIHSEIETGISQGKEIW
ncbi:MAG: AbrB/MazE/SpoVT family DNA-binding domain-containing protein [Actinobacteria bacterium]|nr:AbrB/MazE/SpoVT family DNA-binding domain-containing protein [Actinomycetota bacterium]